MAKIVKIYIDLLAVFSIVYFICARANFDFRKICICFILVISLLFVLKCFFYMVKRKNDINKKEMICAEKEEMIFVALTMLIILGELVFIVFHKPYIYGDDSFYVSMINDTVERNSFYELEPSVGAINTDVIPEKYYFTAYYQFVAMICVITNIHPLIMCKTILAVIYCILSSIVIWLQCELYCSNKYERAILFFIITMLVLFGNYSYYTMARRVFAWNYNSKSVLFTIILPYLFYLILSKEEYWHHKTQKAERNTIKELEYFGEMAEVVWVASVTSLMGVGLAVIEITVLSVVIGIRNKSIIAFLKYIVACFPALIILVGIFLRRRGVML